MAQYSSIEKMIDNVIDIVQKTYFSYVSPEIWDDLRQEGYLAVWRVLGSGDFDPYRNLRTYVYTVARNAMSCFMYHEKKHLNQVSIDILVQEGSVQDIDLIPINNAILDKVSGTDVYFNTDLIPEAKIRQVCYRFSDFGDYEDVTKTNLANIGLYDSKYKDEKHTTTDVEEAIKGIIIYEEIAALSVTS